MDFGLWATCIKDAREKLTGGRRLGTLFQDTHELSLLYAFVLMKRPRGGREPLPTYKDLKGMLSLDEDVVRDIHEYLLADIVPASRRAEAGVADAEGSEEYEAFSVTAL